MCLSCNLFSLLGLCGLVLGYVWGINIAYVLGVVADGDRLISCLYFVDVAYIPILSIYCVILFLQDI